MPPEDHRERVARIRAVAKLIESYFAQLRQELTATGDAFWKRLEQALASGTRPPDRNVSPDKPPDPR